jgi:hypothetical protein
MNGLELSEKYFFEIGLRMLQDKFPNYIHRIAAGLVGEGSECYGFDDEISRDHDWGPGFCLWLTPEDYNIIGENLQKEYNRLPKEFMGYHARVTTPLSGQRVGVFETYSFFKQFTGLNHVPRKLSEWQKIPEEYLAQATNGKVFLDSLRVVSGIRDSLVAYYPEDIRLKKIAARCMNAGQSGQYNFLRSLRRKEYVVAHHALSLFIRDTISIVFLLNRRYMPFYKWMHRGLIDLPILGSEVYSIYDFLVISDIRTSGPDEIYNKIETISRLIIKEIRKLGLSKINSDFLCDHGPVIQNKIKDSYLRSLHVMAG